jgi:hypothetical protein
VLISGSEIAPNGCATETVHEGSCPLQHRADKGPFDLENAIDVVIGVNSRQARASITDARGRYGHLDLEPFKGRLATFSLFYAWGVNAFLP